MRKKNCCTLYCCARTTPAGFLVGGQVKKLKTSSIKLHSLWGRTIHIANTQQDLCLTSKNNRLWAIW